MSTIIVYRYGLLPPIENADLVEVQMRAAHDLRNDLTAIERGRRDALRASTRVSEVESLERQVRELREGEASVERAIRAERAAKRSKSADAQTMKDALKAAREETRVARGKLFEARKSARDAELSKIIEERANALKKDAYRLRQKECGMNWGARWLAEMAADAAREKLPHLFELDGVTPIDPKFRRWSGDGQVTVQLMGDSGVEGEGAPKGLASRDVAGEDTRFRIAEESYVVPKKESAARARWRASGDPRLIALADAPRKTGKDEKLARVLWIRVGSNPDQSPIWAKFPMPKMHRPLPENSVIKRATVSRRMRGPKAEWSVEITLDISLSPRRENCGTGVVAINLGWRAVDGGLRVATMRNERGENSTFILPDDVIGSIRKIEDVREIRDRTFNQARAVLSLWIHEIRELGLGHVFPAWFTDATRTLDDWRSAARLAALCRRWKSDRFEGDSGGYEALERWRYNDHHLWAWEACGRTKSLRYRRDVYRNFAAVLARTYEVAVFEDADYSAIARRIPVDSSESEIAPARSNRFLAAVGELRQHVEHAFRSRGGRAERVEPRDVTQECHACGHAQSFDAAAHVRHACVACGAEWDQDVNAAINILARYRERPSAGPEAGVARSKKSAGKWAKRKAKKAAREEDEGGARSEVDKAAE